MKRRRTSNARSRRDLLADAGIGGALAGLLSLVIWADFGSSRPPDLFAYLFAGALGTLVLARREAPTAVLLLTAAAVLAYYSAGYPGIGLTLPLSVALYSICLAGQPRRAVVVVAGLVAVSIPARLMEGDDPAFVFYDTLATVATLTAFIALGDAHRAKWLLSEESRLRLRRAEQDRQVEAQRLVSAERVSIARDLHDSLSHGISVIALHSLVAQEFAPGLPPQTAEAIRTIRSTAERALQELRRTVRTLRDDEQTAPVEPLPGLADLPELIVRIRAAGLEVDHQVVGDAQPLPPIVDTTAYRVAQEALTNCLRHARARQAQVRVAFYPGSVEITVADDGEGDPPQQMGHGTRGMAERVRLLGGTITAGRRPQRGFSVHARIPRSAT